MITLSSSDDDCKVVPSEPALEEDDDPDNSGLHVKDELNLPDEQGRVLVNMSHPPEEEDIFLAPQLAAAVKPHQVAGLTYTARASVSPTCCGSRDFIAHMSLWFG